MEGDKFQAVIRAAQKLEPANKGDALQLLEQAALLLGRVLDIGTRHGLPMSPTTINRKQGVIVDLMTEISASPALMRDQIDRLRSVVADAFVEWRAMFEGLDSTLADQAAGGIVDFVMNYGAFAGEGAEAVGRGAVGAAKFVLDELLDSPVIVAGLVLLIILVGKK